MSEELRELLWVLVNNQLVRLEGGSNAELNLRTAWCQFGTTEPEQPEYRKEKYYELATIRGTKIKELERDKQILVEDNAELRKQCEDYQEKFEQLRDELVKSTERVRTANREVEDFKKENESLVKRVATSTKALTVLRKALEEIANLSDECVDEDAYNRYEESYIFTR